MFLSHRIFRRAALAFLLLFLLSCGSAHDSGEFYVLVSANLRIPYWKTAGAGFSAAAAQMKVHSDLKGPQTFDPKAERDALDQAVQKKVTGILLDVTDAVLLKDGIDKAIAAGIPVITIDSDAPASKRLFFIGTNNYQAGLMGGQRLAQELKGKGNVVVFTNPDQPNMQDRLTGYKAALARTPDIKITRVVDIQGDPRIAFDTTNQIIGKERDKVDAFVCLEAQSGKDVAGVLNSFHVTGKVVMAMDTDRETLDWIQKGGIAATIAQKPYTMAFVGLEMLDNLYHQKPATLDRDWSKDSLAPIPDFVDTGSALIDKSNVEAFIEAGKSLTSAPK
ncbi:Monosaccharide ABC transporter substrate-binding protein, CUT2 family [Candidatus Sulfotelmatobacter kueseliae]|uniref:Monosaccharide ABC transporter substrate-binding protein, CUT2 family n=1 Tax=Candidatus Sulfotelmatobacter kueseliae TaxID=2042962 RepID=A0A2U3K413_9BACT|nr:Monosaccharide ABC transporter substrate-binding protein, CUT2 family [Candidatus Sulfotelmatobacter kueseliae]